MWLTRITFAFLLAGFLVTVPASADPAVTKKTAATGVSLPLFGQDRTVPAATVKLARLTIGAQRKGFFRVGILPLAVGHEVRILFQKADAAALGDLPATMEALTKSGAIELRDVQFFAPGATSPCLSAATAKIDGAERWQLAGITLPPARTIAKATLHTTGAAAGELIFEEDGSTRKLQLLAPP